MVVNGGHKYGLCGRYDGADKKYQRYSDDDGQCHIQGSEQEADSKSSQDTQEVKKAEADVGGE